MKIGIYTLAFAWNYGGILQAFALRRFLVDRGHDVEFIYRRTDAGIIKNSMKRFKWFMIPFVHKLGLCSNRPVIAVEEFKKKYIVQSPLLFRSSDLRSYCARAKFDVIIVGSDQIWRYGSAQDIYSSFLEFAGDNVGRIAYAASFGVAEWQYPEKETKRCKKLVKEFDAISVREASGVALCKEYLGRGAELVLDPTLLVGRTAFEEVIAPLLPRKECGQYVFTYILDMSAKKKAVITEVSDCLGVEIRPHFRNGTSPTVENWIEGIANAAFVVTDSFHGMCFSILFNKPFIAITNPERGNARFSSLVNLFGLGDRVITVDAGTLKVKELARKEINYDMVEEKLSVEQKKSSDFLVSALQAVKKRI